MKQDDYVTIEVARVLEEQGYECEDRYIPREITIGRFKRGDSIVESKKTYNAPPLQEVAKWLREKHNLHVDVGVAGDSSTDADGNVCDRWTFWMYDIYTIDSLYHFDVDDNREFDTYEQALNEGIRKALSFI